MKKHSSSLLLLLAMILIFQNNLYSYLDPGSGSMILQLLLAVVFAASFAMKSFFKRVITYFKKNKK